MHLDASVATRKMASHSRMQNRCLLLGRWQSQLLGSTKYFLHAGDRGRKDKAALGRCGVSGVGGSVVECAAAQDRALSVQPWREHSHGAGMFYFLFFILILGFYLA